MLLYPAPLDSGYTAAVTRRHFTFGSAAIAAKATYGYPANDRIRGGCIGTGGRAQVLMRNFEIVKGLEIAAVCDIWNENLEKGKRIASPGVYANKEYRAILDRKDIDAVLIGAPDHWHVRMTIDACEAGKDVYVEKPLTHDLSEGQAAIEAQNRHKRIVQVGTQQRSMPQYQKACEIIRSGRLGNVHKVHLTWNRNQARREANARNIHPATVDWKAFLGSANHSRSTSTASAMALVLGLRRRHLHRPDGPPGRHRALDSGFGASIRRVAAIGDQYATKDLWQTPDTVQGLMRYPEQQLQAYFEGTFVNARNGEMIVFMGTEGSIYLDRGRYELHPEIKKQFGQEPSTPTLQYSEMVLGRRRPRADFYKNPNGEALHLTNWMEAMRSRKKPIRAPAEAGCPFGIRGAFGESCVKKRTGRALEGLTSIRSQAFSRTFPATSSYTPVEDYVHLPAVASAFLHLLAASPARAFALPDRLGFATAVSNRRHRGWWRPALVMGCIDAARTAIATTSSVVV